MCHEFFELWTAFAGATFPVRVSAIKQRVDQDVRHRASVIFQELVVSLSSVFGPQLPHAFVKLTNKDTRTHAMAWDISAEESGKLNSFARSLQDAALQDQLSFVFAVQRIARALACLLDWWASVGE